MFQMKLQINSAEYVKSLQEVMFTRAYKVARVFQNSVMDSIGKQASNIKEHAYPNYPPLRHTGDLQASIHIYGGFQPSGDVYFTVYCVAVYGAKLEETHPFMRPVFNRMAADSTVFMSQGYGLGSNYMIGTSSRDTKRFIHQYTTQYPTLPALTDIRFHAQRSTI